MSGWVQAPEGFWSLRRVDVEVARVWRVESALWGAEAQGQVLAVLPGFEVARRLVELYLAHQEHRPVAEA